MKIKSSFILLLGFGLILACISSGPVLAHHSFAAQYDRSKPMITGPVTKIDWINPHARFFVNVKDRSGKVVNWEVEHGPPAGLMRRGWSRNTLKVGEPVTVNGFVAEDGSNLTNAQTVTLSDGRKVFAGSSADGTNP
jgi:hypothetical protein